ncbi:MAG TPA: ATP-binding protein [Geobacteraceae bacterium]|nr:ATP-binding protein [Geobacteraceae bacterium]
MDPEGKILIIGDEQLNVELISGYLSGAGYEVVLADSGKESTEVTGTPLPDIIIVDIAMPGMEGFEIVRTLKRHRKTGRIPTILITARNNAQNTIKGLECGADEFLVRPVRKPDILASVRSFLELKKRQEKIMEDILKEEKDFAVNLIQNISAPIFVLDANHRIIIWNKACEELTGFKASEMIGDNRQWQPFYSEPRPTLADVVIDGDTDAASELYPESTKSRINPLGLQSEGWFTTRGGREIHLFFDAEPVYDSEGKLMAVIESFRDTTDRKRAELALIKSQAELLERHEQLHAIFEQVETAKQEWERTMDCVGDIVILAGQDEGIKRCNKALCDFTGKTYAEIVGKNWKALLSDSGLDIPASPPYGAGHFHEPTGRWLVMEFHELPGRPPKNDPGSVITLRDVTEVKKFTRELEESNIELESTREKIIRQEKMACIGRLAAGVAHEVNNPVSYISSNLNTLAKYVQVLENFIRAQSEMLDETGIPELAGALLEIRKDMRLDHILPDARDLIRESIEGANRIKTIVGDLINFSRIDESGYIDADINECVESAIKIVWNELKQKATTVRNLGRIPRIKCNPRQLNQVFVNLLVNAAQAIEQQGLITVRTWHESDSIYVSITDTGCGIPESILDRIFEPFFTTKEAGKGAGLGLSITYDIIKKHDGEISVESEIGKGTTFAVRLPVKDGNGNGRKDQDSLRR